MHLWLYRRMAMQQAHPDSLSAVFSALGNPTRRAILARLARGEATVLELGEPFGLSQPTISKHLKVLEDAGLVSRGRDAQRRPVHLETKVLDAMTTWIERYRREAEERYRRLDDVLAAMLDQSADQPSGERSHRGEQP